MTSFDTSPAIPILEEEKKHANPLRLDKSIGPQMIEVLTKSLKENTY
jgi:hypothetical protein